MCWSVDDFGERSAGGTWALLVVGQPLMVKACTVDVYFTSAPRSLYSLFTRASVRAQLCSLYHVELMRFKFLHIKMNWLPWGKKLIKERKKIYEGNQHELWSRLRSDCSTPLQYVYYHFCIRFKEFFLIGQICNAQLFFFVSLRYISETLSGVEWTCIYWFTSNSLSRLCYGHFFFFFLNF